MTIDTSKFYEVQKYVTETNHAYTPFLFLFSKPIFDSYTPEEQAALRECAVVGRDEERKVIRELNQKSLERSRLPASRSTRCLQKSRLVSAKSRWSFTKSTRLKSVRTSLTPFWRT